MAQCAQLYALPGVFLGALLLPGLCAALSRLRADLGAVLSAQWYMGGDYRSIGSAFGRTGRHDRAAPTARRSRCLHALGNGGAARRADRWGRLAICLFCAQPCVKRSGGGGLERCGRGLGLRFTQGGRIGRPMGESARTRAARYIAGFLFCHDDRCGALRSAHG